MALLAVGSRRWGRWWTLCLVGVILLLRDARAQNPDNHTSPCSHFKSVRHVEFFKGSFCIRIRGCQCQ